MDEREATPLPGGSNASAPGAPGGVRARRWLLAGVAMLYVFSVPWYREPDPDPPLWLGLPSWVTVALLCYAGASVLNAFAWFWTPIVDDAQVAFGPAKGDSGAEESP